MLSLQQLSHVLVLKTRADYLQLRDEPSSFGFKGKGDITDLGFQSSVLHTSIVQEGRSWVGTEWTCYIACTEAAEQMDMEINLDLLTSETLTKHMLGGCTMSDPYRPRDYETFAQYVLARRILCAFLAVHSYGFTFMLLREQGEHVVRMSLAEYSLDQAMHSDEMRSWKAQQVPKISALSRRVLKIR